MDGTTENIPVAKAKKPRKKQDNLDKRLDAATKITKLFQAERYIYMSCCGIAVVLLIYCAVTLIADKSGENSWQDKMPVLTALFGSGGLITYSTGRLIYMWNKMIEVILMHNENEDKDNGN